MQVQIVWNVGWEEPGDKWMISSSLPYVGSPWPGYCGLLDPILFCIWDFYRLHAKFWFNYWHPTSARVCDYASCECFFFVNHMFMTCSQLSRLVYDLSITCLWLVHYLFIKCLWLLYDLFLTNWLPVHDLFISCSWPEHYLFITCSLLAYYFFITCS